MWLDAPTRLLNEGRPAAALEAMLEAWRVRRVPALANLIDVLSDALTSRLPRLEARTRSGLQGLWLDLANERRDVDLGRLLALFAAPPWVAVGQRIERLAQLDDPRVARAFASFFQNLPTVGGIGTARWTMLFSALERMKDVRVRAALEPRSHLADPRVIVNEQLLPLARRVLGALPEDPTTADDVAQVHELAVLVKVVLQAPLPAAAALLDDTVRARRPTSEAELLQLIYETPEDDTPRLVYGDWLQEQGDPRAELLMLQLKPQQTTKEQQLARRLLRQHGRSWLGPIEPAIPPRTEVFQRGFVSEARVTFATAHQREALLGHPAWNTFTSLTVGGSVDGTFLEKTELRGLEALRFVSQRELEQLHRRPWPFRRLRALALSRDGVHTLGLVEPRQYPALRELAVSVGPGDRLLVERALRSNVRLLERLERLRLVGVQTTELLVMLAGFSNLQQVTLTAFAPLAFHRVGPGWVLDLQPSPFELRRGQNIDRALKQFMPLVTGVVEPSKDWGEDLALAKETLDGVRKRAGLEFVPRAVIGD
ncbi:MAG: TIGR02996 domain-containing protein [Archangium sp.]|nr:TIGR02996 domain-containing protein [Archangium sp.]